MRLLTAGQGVPGRVLDTRCLDTPILARVRESDVPAEGAEIGVAVESGAVLVFETENGGQSPSR